MKFSYKGFTLMELLVVIAISIVLMGLLLIPIMKTLETNRMTAAYTTAQQNSRVAMQMIRKDISEAMYVADSESTPMLLPVNGLVDADGNGVSSPIRMQYAVINLMMPKTEFYCDNPNHNTAYPRTFERGENYRSSGKELAINKCPYCGTEEYVKVTPKIPVEKSTTVVRYFLGLRENGSSAFPIMTTEDANNIANWVTAEGQGWLPDSGDTSVEGDENQLILYRVEFDPVSDNGLFPEEYSLDGLSSSSAEYQKRLHKRITDPNVFYHPDCCENWAAIAQNVGMLEGLDLAICKSDDYVDGHPYKVNQLVSFTPASISGETPVPNASTTYSQDDQGYPPVSFKTKYALLGNSMEVDCVRVNPANQRPVDKWVMKHLVGSNDYYANVYHVSHLNDINPNVNDSDLEFNVNNYMVNGEVDDLDQEMAFKFNAENGYLDFSMVPVPWPDLDEDIQTVDPNLDNVDPDKIRFVYYPELEVYAYRFNPYSNATIVPGSEDVEYYNAYWVNGSNYSFVDLGYNYNDLYNETVSTVKYQRAAFSIGQLNFNQYKIDYEKGIIYWKALLNHDPSHGIYPIKYRDIPRIKSYRIQFNEKTDKITVSYLTNQVIDVNLNMSVVWDTYKKPRTGSINERVVVGNSLK